MICGSSQICRLTILLTRSPVSISLPRLGLQQLLTTASLTAKFSPRFLREMTIFPCQSEKGRGNKLVVADPTDSAAVRAAEIVLGGPVAVEVASFEDIATILSKRLGEDEPLASEADVPACSSH